MTNSTLSEGSVVLRLEFSIADAVHQRGLLSVLGTAIAAWWQRPRMPATLPANLRADVGLPPEHGPLMWYSVPAAPVVPQLPRRRRH